MIEIAAGHVRERFDGFAFLLTARPAWMGLGACQDRPDVNFFPEWGENLTAARAVWASCPVREECLAYALDHREFGVRGGKSERERRNLRRARRVA